MPTTTITRRQFKSRMATKQDVWRAIPALLGDGNGTVEVPGQPGMVYIRVGDGDLGQAFNNRCQLRDNLAVYVGYDPITDPDRHIFQVLTVRMADYAGAGYTPVPNVGPHNLTHYYGGGDDIYVEWRRLMGLRVGRPSAFVVTVDPGIFYTAGAWTEIPSTTVDLSAEHAALIGVQAQYTLISLSSAGVVTHTNGTPVASIALLTMADCPSPPAGHIPLAAVRLYKVQTAIDDVPAAPDIVDLRFPTYATMGGIGAGIAGYVARWLNAYSLTTGILQDDASDTVTIGTGAAGIDYELAFNGETNDGLIEWMEDEDWFAFYDSILFPDSEPLYFGTGADMSIDYDGSVGNIKTDLVAASDLHIDCGTDKTIVLDEVVWDDLRVTSGSFDRPGTSDPTIVAYDVNGGGVSTYLWQFAKNNIASFVAQLPHSYKQGEDISVHIHWTPGPRGAAENGNTVGWKVDYSWANIDGTFPTMSTADLSDTCDGTNHKHQMTPAVTIDGHTAPAKNISSMLICNVKRTDTGADDTWAGTISGELPMLLEIDFHFPIDTIGSRQDSAK